MRPFFQLECVLFVLTISAQFVDAQTFRFLDLQMRKNQEVTEEFANDGRDGNTLDGVPMGEQEMAGVKFKIGKGIVYLGSTVQKNRPEKAKRLSSTTTMRR